MPGRSDETPVRFAKTGEPSREGLFPVKVAMGDELVVPVDGAESSEKGLEGEVGPDPGQGYVKGFLPQPSSKLGMEDVDSRVRCWYYIQLIVMD